MPPVFPVKAGGTVCLCLRAGALVRGGVRGGQDGLGYADYAGGVALGDILHDGHIALGRVAELQVFVNEAQIDVGTPGAVRGRAEPVEYLAEQLQVGTVSNMYEIVERMKQAGKVISL